MGQGTRGTGVRGRTGALGAVALALTAAAWGPATAQEAPAGFRVGATAAGVARTVGPETLGGVAWTFETEGPVRGSPTLAGGVVYVGSTDGRLYALAQEDGALRWSYDAGAPLGGAPLVTRDRVTVVARGNVVHSVDRATGRPVWSVATGPDLPLEWGLEGWDYLLPSPVPAGDLLLVGSGDGHLYALDADDGSEWWRFPTGGRIRSAPTVVDGVAYVGSGDGIVYGVEVADGSEAWRFRTAGAELDARDFGFDRTQIQGSPVVADGVLYIGSRDASLYAVRLADGEVLWTAEDGTAWVVDTPALEGGRVFNGRSSSGLFRGLDAATGAELWVHDAGGPVFSSPTVAGATVYVGSGSGRVWALEAATGAVRWAFATGGAVHSSPAVRDGRLFVGSDDGTVYALRAAAGPAPRRAVYWDDGLRDRSTLGSRESHRRLTAHFEDRGYELLDSTALPRFLEGRIADGAPSVVVFGMDGVPASVIDPADPPSSLLRRYLEAGGKAVWPATPPLLLERDADGRVQGVDRGGPEALLGVDHGAWNSDVYGVRPTEAGRRWGLETPFLGSPSIAPEGATTVLAVDELGHAVAWVRSYGGPEGTGWVAVPATLDPTRLEEVRRVAEHGIFRSVAEVRP